MYSPLKRWQAGSGKVVGILGIGGLGHVAIKIAKAMGAQVVVFTTSEAKVADATRLGAFNVVKGRRSFSGSNIGGIAETQEMLEFCAKHGITADIELISASQVNDAFSRLEKGDVKYRFVLDMSTLQ